MSTQHNHDEQTINLTRRQALKGAAVGTAAVGVGLNTPVNRARAGWFDDDDDQNNSTPGLSVASPGLGLVSATAKVLGWTSGDSNQAAKADLRQAAYWDASRYYRSVVRELSLNSDLLEYVPDGVFSDAKIKAIEKMNAGATRSETKTAALDLAKQEMSTLEKNVIEAGNQGVKTIANYLSQAKENGIAESDIISIPEDNTSFGQYSGTTTLQVTLIDGTTYDNVGINFTDGDGASFDSFAVGEDAYGLSRKPSLLAEAPDGNDYPVLPIHPSDWSTGGYNDGVSVPPEYQSPNTTINDMRDKIVNKWTNDLEPDIITWVDNSYDAYASGDVNPEDLLTASETATLISDEEPANRAIAHLRASGISVKPDNPATIETTAEGGTVTVKKAVLGSTGTSSSLSVGDTVTPSNLSYDYSVGYTSENVAVQWPHYTTTLDGGQLTVGKTPSTEVVEWVGRPLQMVVQTSKGETATIDPFAYGSPENPSAGFTVDLSGQLNEPIADVTKITIFSAKDSPVSATKFLDKQFTLVSGAKDSYDFTHDRSVQTTDNYVTAEEWEQRNEELQKIIEELRDDGGGGGGGGGLFGGGPNIPTLPGLGVIESAVVVALGFAGLNALTS
jgi:hypothetical protein